MVTKNPLLVGARGGLGKVVVFKQMYAKTVITNYPRKVEIPREKQSTAQRETRDNFRDAVAYAKAVLKDPVQKAYYERKKKQLRLNSAYQAAITDCMQKLKLESVNMKRYTGAVGGEIVMTVRKKDFGARDVGVMLLSIERGRAVKDKHGAWVYRNTAEAKDTGDVVVRVEDEAISRR
jgi:hypothetical protein